MVQAPALSNIITQTLQVVVPCVSSAFIQMSSQDFRIGQIAGGIGLAVSGVSLIISSGIPKTLKSWYLKSPQESKSIPKILHWVTADVGKIITGYGIYNIASGVRNVKEPNSCEVDALQPKETLLSCPEAQDLWNEVKAEGAFAIKRSKDTEAPTGVVPWVATPAILLSEALNANKPNSCEVDVLQAKETLLSCPEAQACWNEVEVEGAFSIKCSKDTEAPTGAVAWIETPEIFSSKIAWMGTREISLSEKDEDKLSGLLASLNNLKWARPRSLVPEKKCGLDADDYARNITAMQYEATQDAYKIYDQCVKRGVWPSDSPTYQTQKEAFSGKSDDIDWSSLEGFLEYQEQALHTDLYRMNWYKQCDPKGLSKWAASNEHKWREHLTLFKGE